MIAALLVGTAACGGTAEYAIQGTTTAVGADGQVTIERQDAGNYLVTTTVTDLPPPSRIGEELTTYVVWIQPPNQTPQRVGALSYDTDERSGSMSATTAVTSFQLIISGEVAPDVATPSEQVVFRTSVEAPE